MSAFIGKCHVESDEEEDDDEELTTVIKRSYSADCVDHEATHSGSDTDSEEDSDAEFLVHPCLRSLIKSKSAYTVPKYKESVQANFIKPSKTSFEISLSRMIESTTRSLEQEAEYSVADLLPTLDQKWPDPQEKLKEKPKKKTSVLMRYSPSVSGLSSSSDELSISSLSHDDEKENQRPFECWSSPPNFYMDEPYERMASPANQKCWSAPDLIEEDTCEMPTHCQPLKNPILKELIDSVTGYPVIETPDNDPSVCSYRLPSSPGTPSSPSPPRPFSPVFGRPAPMAYRLHQSRSMHLPSRPDIAAFLADASSDVTMIPNFNIGGTSEEDNSEDDGEIEEEVWPEEGVARVCWSDQPGMRTVVPRSATFQISHDPSDEYDISRRALHPSRSAELYNLCIGDESNENEDEALLDPSENHRLTGSEHSQLDDGEKKALENRQVWMDRGSILCLGANMNIPQNNHIHPRNRLHPELIDGGVHCDGIQSQYGSFSSLAQAEASSSSMRRSCTTDEFRRAGRRRLPRRPDEMSVPVELPQSKSMYERTLCAQFGSRNSMIWHEEPQQPADYTVIRMEEKRNERPPTLALQSTINTIIESNRNKMDAPSTRRNFDHLETPISPHAVLISPSGSSSGRRLPPLPVNSAVLLRRFPANMSLPPNGPKPQDHTLCFMDGMADSMMERSGIGGMEDSYYEEDGINGNNNRRRRQGGRKSFFSPDDSSGVSSCTTSDSMNPTHRVQSAFHPRHPDELLLEIGDAVHVDRTADDHWSYGTNLRTGQSGIFPASVVCEIDLVEEICLGALPSNSAKPLNDDRDTFYLTMLASIEVAHHKGNDVLVQAMNKVLSMYKNSEEIIVPQTVLMEISFRGIHVIDKRRKNFFQCPMFDFFYSLQNISFCGAHPKQLKYFGFITKHPLLPRFACHVFMSNSSTQAIVEAIGRAFKRSYDEYMAFAHPTEDIYLE